MSTTTASAIELQPPQPRILGEVCPLCDQEIPPGKLVEIQRRERDRAAKQSRELRELLEGEKAAALARQEKRLQRAAAATAEKAELEARERESAARAGAKAQAESEVTAKLAELEVSRKNAEEATSLATEQLEKLQSEQATAEAKFAEREKAARAETRAQTETELAARLAEQRESLDKAFAKESQKAESKAFSERQKLEAQLSRVQRELKKQLADEGGEEAELDLNDALREAFPKDSFRPIDKGSGADLWQEVVANGEVCGLIIYDSRTRGAWRNHYVGQLKQDQLNANAGFAILATRKFPSRVRQLHVQNRVILAHPARVVALVSVLREQLINAHRLKISAQAREAKTAALYEFINSDRCHRIFEHHETLINELLSIDELEKKEHDKLWVRRGELLEETRRAIRIQLLEEIDRIVIAGELT